MPELLKQKIQALSKIKKIEEALSKVKVPRLKIDLFNELALAVKFIDVQRGISLSQEALSAAQELHYHEGVAEASYNLSRFHSIYLGDKQLGRDYAISALNEYQSINNMYGEARTLILLASLSIEKKDCTSAMDYLQKGQHIAIREGFRNLEGASYAEYGMYYKMFHKMDLAIEYYQRALEIWVSENNQEGEAVVLHNLGMMYDELGNNPQAMKYHSKSLNIRKVLQDEYGISSSLHNVASIYIKSGDYENALLHFNQSLKLKQKIGYKLGAADTLNCIGSIYGEMKNYEMALQYHSSSLKIYKELNLDTKIALALNNISVDQMRLGNKEKGLEIALESYTISKLHENIQGVISSCLNVATVYKVQKDFKNALQYAEEGLTLCKSIQRRGQFPSYYIEIASILYEEGKYDTSLQYLNDAIELCLEFEANRLLAMAYYALSFVYEKLENYTESLRNMRLYVELKEQIQDETALHRSQLLLSKIEIEQVKSENTSILTKVEEIERQQKLCTHELQIIGLHLVEKQEFLKQINGLIHQNLNQFPICNKCNLRNLIPLIDSKIEGNKQWQLFTEKFDRSHDEFIKRLSNKFPILTQTELKVATLLRINMENKDIANLLCSSVRTVEWHRRNIRKKMGIKVNENLSVFLNAW